MNTQAIATEIQNIIATAHSQTRDGGRRQYRASKADIAKLTELGILQYVPNAPYEKFVGSLDAKAVIASATDSGKEVGGFVDYEGSSVTTAPSALYQLLNTVETVEEIANVDEILDAVELYQNSREEMNPDFWSLVNESTIDMSGQEKRDYLDALRAQIHQGEKYHEQGYRVRYTHRHTVSIANTPVNAIASKSVNSGHRAFDETHRTAYLVKI